MPFGLNLFGGVSFSPATDIPSLKGKVVLVTGGNNGLGKQSILELASHEPESIWMAARDPTKAATAIDDIKAAVPGVNIKFLKLDLASLDSVRTAAKEFVAAEERLDILLLNAGVMALAPGLTADGYEIQFGTNHMGHALLTKLLLPTLLKTAAIPDTDVRVVSLSSAGHALAYSGLEFDSLKTDAAAMGAYPRYGQSKLANILFARQLAKEHPQIKAISVHPGIVRTNLINGTTGTPRIFQYVGGLVNNVFTPVEKGALNQLWAATSPDVVNGEYYTPVGVLGGGNSYANDLDLTKQLWDWTEKELDEYLAKVQQ
ncbi:hypothetical protein TD95_002761 [Thielaviopsis punctulata]|uniref:Oxidoreductase n=1 Tax=Thielaviopsis punctulata TaxID=72032 RepID=A0A0F4ZBN1_9PEZI|nr:hypothetical protein TD95_002761 [Thielaviopsis punctulata]